MNTLKSRTQFNPIRKTWSLSAMTIGALLMTQTVYADTSEMMSAVSVKVEQDEQTLAQSFSRAGQAMTATQQASAQIIKQSDVKLTARKTREQVIAERQTRSGTTKKLKSATQRIDAGIYHEFGIYEASARLFEDFDYDGFYRTFSVTFDADVYSYYVGEQAQVYADLYLSRDGGPWELYHTTDVFTIVDDVSDDDFEVLTTLHTGYPSDHYDVLIDLYEEGYSDIVATISSDDVDDLYALPLESADRDVEYIDDGSTEVVVSGGSLSVMGLTGLLLLVGMRRRS